MADNASVKEGMIKGKLKRALPPNRSFEQIWNHFQVERSLATKLKQADRQERKALYETMYDELFLKVPDHPRLTSRSSEELTASANRSKFNILGRFLNRSTVFLEFAPGDCRFATELCSRVGFVYGVDISDQRGMSGNTPDNFKLIIYDGYELKIDPDSVDVVFSDQLIEHLHPDDTWNHFEVVRKVLKRRGVYVFRTPHRFTGPHDISGYFSDVPEGFHLKEWTYGELAEVLKNVGYSSWHGIYQAKGRCIRVPVPLLLFAERTLSLLPREARKAIAAYFPRTVAMVAVK